ncbi:glycine cleavage system aminomethyltransferase GcvT [Dermacoccus nishinomiyaensis]|uniref:glycine cleavage system aminomethyltransferase GcvT n=1 Tax=Dermacoccus nishinomiyaensis TaxID=1274 RepID=UPI000E03DCE4|nr:glycine cleavage system aminomethyltransferase GcvT [Dermacoccus nishinomiyaensis]QQY23352.1 glycine cleavage system aminomethyltransferase GcvT [Dermacoccus nishinomiyaensis]STD16110.1 Aminomethyltransferase [Dermacoccus nishinomiyaensis]
MTENKLSPLDERHRALGAKMADFGGWDMPIEYPGGGVVREHTAVRERVGIFDVSHLGKATVKGAGALDFVNSCLTNDLRKIGPGQAQYTMCCDESGGVVDDLIVYVKAEDDLFLIPNATNTAEVVRRLKEAAPEGIEVADAHEEYAVLAVQGPKSDEVVSALALPVDHDYMSFDEADWQGRPVTVCRTGYTGERGYELVCRWDDALALWDALVEAAAPYEGLPCGLGARDTLRTEMGYPLHGQDLSLDITPVQARSGWAVGWKKDAFWGKDALTKEKAEGPRRISRGLKLTGRGIPRAHCIVRDAEGAELGEVTSGTFSPTLGMGVALALVSPMLAEGDQVVVDVRGRMLEAVVTKPPFVEVQTRSS